VHGQPVRHRATYYQADEGSALRNLPCAADVGHDSLGQLFGGERRSSPGSGVAAVGYRVEREVLDDVAVAVVGAVKCRRAAAA